MSIDRDKVLQTAQKFVERKRFDKAIAEYQKLVQHDGNDARTLLKIGDLQTRMGAYEQAISTYERVARYYGAQGMSLKAIAVYKQIRELIRKHAPSLANQYGHILPSLAKLYLDLGLTGDALTAYDEYAARLHASGRDGEAIDVFKKIVEINGNNPLTRLRFGEALIRQSRVEEALQEFSVAAEILLEMGRSDDALKVIERMLFQKPAPKHARRAAEIYLQRGTAEDGMLALAKLQICFQADNRDLDTLQLLASAFELIGQAPKAVEVRKEIARIARDKGEFALARETAEALLAEAADDEGVKSLAMSILAAEKASMMPGALDSLRPESVAPAASPSAPEVTVEVSEQEVVPPPKSLDRPHSVRPKVVAPQSRSALGVDDFEPLSALLESLSDAGASVSGTSASGDAPRVEDAQSHERIINLARDYCGSRQFDQAIALLRGHLKKDEHNVHVLDMLREVLVTVGDYAGACEQLMTMASLYLDALDVTTTANLLVEVLELDPTHVAARTMLVELGYELPTTGVGQAGGDLQMDVDAPATAQRGYHGAAEQARPDSLELFEPLPESVLPPSLYPPSQAKFGTAQPLPSYDLEEIEPQFAMSSVPTTSSLKYANLLQSDDPFSALAVPHEGAAQADGSVEQQPQVAPAAQVPQRLPSFPLLEDPAAATRSQAARRTESVQQRQLPSYDDRPPLHPTASSPPGTIQDSVLVPLAGTRTQAFRGGDSLEDALEEAEFFASRALFDDAIAILREQQERYPDNPLLLERMAEVQHAMAASTAASYPPDAGHLHGVEDDPVYNMAASMDNMNAGTVDAFFASDQPQAGSVDVEDVFAQFKQGVREQVSDTDSQTHFDLGVAYKEMGLWNDAIAAFELAAKDPRRECVCWSMIGLVRLQLGDLDGAIEAFIRGLHATYKTDQQELALYYELGAVYEQRGSTQEALHYFDTVMVRDPHFRDVQQRIAWLRGGMRAVDESANDGRDEFDQEFDRVFGERK